MSDVLIAKESFVTEIDGVHYSVTKGLTRVASDHALARQSPEYFEEPKNDLTYGAEQATKKPGEKRGSKQDPKKEAKQDPKKDEKDAE